MKKEFNFHDIKAISTKHKALDTPTNERVVAKVVAFYEDAMVYNGPYRKVTASESDSFVTVRLGSAKFGAEVIIDFNSMVVGKRTPTRFGGLNLSPLSEDEITLFTRLGFALHSDYSKAKEAQFVNVRGIIVNNKTVDNEFDIAWVKEEIEGIMDSGYFTAKDIFSIDITDFAIYIQAAKGSKFRTGWYMSIGEPGRGTTLHGPEPTNQLAFAAVAGDEYEADDKYEADDDIDVKEEFWALAQDKGLGDWEIEVAWDAYLEITTDWDFETAMEIITNYT